MEFKSKKSLGALCVALSLSLVGCASAQIPASVTPGGTPTSAPVATTPTPTPSPTPGGGASAGVDVGVDVGATPTPIATPAPTSTTPPFLPGTAVGNGGTAVGGGGGGGGGGGAVATLSVAAVGPAAPTAGMLTATFTQAMLGTSVNTTTFKLHNLTTIADVAGTVTYVGTTATFKPTGALTAGDNYRATITTGVQSMTGTSPTSDYSWTFIAGAADLLVPTVSLAINPTNLATGIATNAAMTATFSEAMAPATITNTTFTLTKEGVGPVAGTVTHTGTTATFTPTAILDVNANYTANLTTGATDLSNNVLAAYSWSFQTTALAQASVPITAWLAKYLVLSGAGITNTGGTMVNGDVGSHPTDTYTGLSAIHVPAPNVIHPAGPDTLQAKLDLTAAYDNAAGRNVAPFPVAGNLGGRTLTPGLYNSTSTLAVSSGDLTLDARGDSTAVFIIQMADTFTMTSGRKIFLTNGAKAANIFWQVGSSATFGTTAVMKGTIMADQAISFATGATLEGRALARIAAVTLDTNTITYPTP